MSIENKYFMYNGKLQLAENFEKLKPHGDKLLYEVVRIIDGKPLFFKEHVERLNNSIKLTNLNIFIDLENLLGELLKLSEENKVNNGNVKIVLDGNNRFMFFIKHSYPTEDMYENGVKTILYFGERNNPNAKIINNDFRSKVNEKIKENNAYEAILIDRNGNITEGSKSNIFMIKGNDVITSPVIKVLPGITRMKVIEVCKLLNLNVIEREINHKEIGSLDGLFISGTSPKVLPICSVDDYIVDSQKNHIIKDIMNKFQEMINVSLI